MVFDRGGLEMWERVESRETEEGVDTASITFNYIIRGSTSDLAVKKYLIAQTALLYDGMKRESASIKPLGEDWWEGEVRYTWKEAEDKDDEGWPKPSYSFDTKGGTFHISHSIKTTGTHSATGEPAPNFDGGIGVTKDKIDGVDVIIPKLSFQETHHFPLEYVTAEFLKDLARATGKVNSDTFRTFAPGELLFLGASGSKGESDVAITYGFEASQNNAGLTVGNVNQISKKGHEYLWTYYTDQADSSSGATVNKLRAVYVEQVYEEISFTASLGLPDHVTPKQRKSIMRKDRARARNAAAGA